MFGSFIPFNIFIRSFYLNQATGPIIKTYITEKNTDRKVTLKATTNPNMENHQ